MDMQQLIGEGKELTALQMSVRALIIFIITLIYLRISGKRSFGMQSPFDLVVSILLGAVLSRGVVGASPFGATLAAGLTLVLMHRFCAWASLHHEGFGRLIKGESKVIYENGKLIRDNMDRSLISEKDLMQHVRYEGQLESLDQVERAHVERNGKISIIPKK